jgi:dinuclear metal center YbgI/SA1388 family protein
MPTTVADVVSAVERLWPAAGAEAWDAPGLIVGAPDQAVSHIRLAVDAVGATVDDALVSGADMLLVHHPLLLRGVTTIAESTYQGSVLSRLVRGGVALLAAHTNADVVETGTSATIATALGLRDVVPIVPDASGTRGLGSVGELAARLGALLPETATGIRVAGDYARPVSRVAICAGAGDSLLNAAPVRGSDVYITSDLRHHPASAAVESGGPALIDTAHWASEWLWLAQAAAQLREILPELTVTVSDVRTDPWDFVIVQSPDLRRAP